MGNNTWATARPAVSDSFRQFPAVSCAWPTVCRPPGPPLLSLGGGGCRPLGAPQPAPPLRAEGA
eukprot:11009814-Alexandrium_andersonii.AAC.1